MKTRKALSLIILLTTLGCVGLAKMTSLLYYSDRSPEFSLTQLKNSTVMIWPIQSSDIRGFIIDQLVRKYGSEREFINLNDSAFSKKVKEVVSNDSLASDGVASFLNSNEDYKKFIHPLPNGIKSQQIDFGALSRDPNFNKFKYAIIPAQIHGDWWGKNEYIDIKILVVEIQSGKVVWRGMDNEILMTVVNLPYMDRVGWAFSEAIRGEKTESKLY